MSNTKVNNFEKQKQKKQKTMSKKESWQGKYRTKHILSLSYNLPHVRTMGSHMAGFGDCGGFNWGGNNRFTCGQRQLKRVLHVLRRFDDWAVSLFYVNFHKPRCFSALTNIKTTPTCRILPTSLANFNDYDFSTVKFIIFTYIFLISFFFF